MWKKLWKWKSGKEKSEAHRNRHQSVLLKYPPGGQVKACKEKQEFKYFRLPKSNRKGGMWWGLWKLLPLGNYCLMQLPPWWFHSQVLGRGPRVIVRHRTSIWVDETNGEEDKLVPANILCMFITMLNYNDLLRVMASASILPSKFHAVILVNSNLVP